MFEGLLTAGLAFWLIPFLILDSILLIYWIDREYSGLATASLIVTGAILQWCFGIDIIGFVIGHPSIICYAALIYFAVGTIWAVTKWWFFVTAERQKYDEFKENWLSSHGLSLGNTHVIPDDQKKNFQQDLRCTFIEVRPLVTRHKARIYMWMTYWPFSALWTLTHDFVNKVFTTIYTKIRTTLQKISDHAWAGTDQDLPKN